MDKKHPVLTKSVTVGIIVLTVIIGWYAYQAYDGKLNTTYVITPPSTSHDRLLVMNTPDGEKYISIYHQMIIHTTSLSALNPIFVEFEIFPTIKFKDEKEWERIPKTLQVHFPQALNYDQTNSLKPTQIRGIMFIELEKYDNPKRFYGNATMVYQFEGDYGYAFIPPEILQAGSTEGTVFLSNDLLDKYMQKCCMYHIGSSDLTNTVETNNIFLSLTLIFIGFTFVETRPQIINGVCWSWEKIYGGLSWIKVKRQSR